MDFLEGYRKLTEENKKIVEEFIAKIQSDQEPVSSSQNQVH